MPNPTPVWSARTHPRSASVAGTAHRPGGPTAAADRGRWSDSGTTSPATGPTPCAADTYRGASGTGQLDHLIAIGRALTQHLHGAIGDLFPHAGDKELLLVRKVIKPQKAEKP